eukprot:scaffold154273_cov37-Tisochrysis_lutea.AAC.6
MVLAFDTTLTGGLNSPTRTGRPKPFCRVVSISIRSCPLACAALAHSYLARNVHRRRLFIVA